MSRMGHLVDPNSTIRPSRGKPGTGRQYRSGITLNRGEARRWRRLETSHALLYSGEKREELAIARERAGMRGGVPTRPPKKPLTLTLSPEYRGEGIIARRRQGEALHPLAG